MPVEFTADRLSYIAVALFLALALGAILDRSSQQGRRWPIYACGIWALALAPLTLPASRYLATNARLSIGHSLALSEQHSRHSSMPPRSTGWQENRAKRWRGSVRSGPAIRSTRWFGQNEIALLLQDGRLQRGGLSWQKEAVRNIPGSLALNYRAGVLLVETGRPGEALVYLRKARELGPQGGCSQACAFISPGRWWRAARSKNSSVLELLELSTSGGSRLIRRCGNRPGTTANGDFQQKAAHAKKWRKCSRSRQKKRVLGLRGLRRLPRSAIVRAPCFTSFWLSPRSRRIRAISPGCASAAGARLHLVEPLGFSLDEKPCAGRGWTTGTSVT